MCTLNLGEPLRGLAPARVGLCPSGLLRGRSITRRASRLRVVPLLSLSLRELSSCVCKLLAISYGCMRNPKISLPKRNIEQFGSNFYQCLMMNTMLYMKGYFALDIGLKTKLLGIEFLQ
jgi:hypothetical protein